MSGSDHHEGSLLTVKAEKEKLHRAALRTVQHADGQGWDAETTRELLEAIGYVEYEAGSYRRRNGFGLLA